MVVFLRYINDYRYIPENEILGDILGWTVSFNTDTNPTHPDMGNEMEEIIGDQSIETSNIEVGGS